MRGKWLFAILAIFLTVGISHADVTIVVPQNNHAWPWGIPDTATYGQTVTVPVSDTELDSFTFYLGPQYEGSGPINYQAYVYAWDSGTAMASGSALYESVVQTYAPGAGYSPVPLRRESI